LASLLGLGQLAVHIGVVEVELADAAVQILDLGRDGRRLLLLRKHGRCLRLVRRWRKRTFLAAGEAAYKKEQNRQPGFHGCGKQQGQARAQAAI
jgi:hypothetical protein